MNKIIVLGNGYIGKQVYKHLTSTMTDFDVKLLNSYEYNCPSVLRETLFTNLKTEFITNREIHPHTSQSHETNQKWLINCVGYTGKPNVDACENDKQTCWDLNVTFPTLLANECAKYNVKIINISSGCIYDTEDGKSIFNEEDWPNFGLNSSSSSWYSRTKHAAELNLNAFDNIYTLRIRMPICNNFNSSKNYLTKILKYNDILQEVNSKTVIEDLYNTVSKIIYRQDIPTGIYNCVNPEPLDTKTVTQILDKYGMWNPNWNFIDYNGLKNHIKANRSNCILTTDKCREVGIEFPSEEESLHRILAKTNEE